MTDVNDFLLGGGGGKSAKFDQVGDTISGTIESTDVKQQTDIATGAPLTWDNGDPRLVLAVRLQTDQKEDADDDGARSLYVKGSKKPGSRSLHDAVASAVRQAGAKGLEEGGTLTVKYVGEEPSATRGFNPRKLYEATYVAPDKSAASGEFLGSAPAPAAAPASPAGGKQPTPEELAAFEAFRASQAK